MLQQEWTLKHAKWNMPDTKRHIVWVPFYKISRLDRFIETENILEVTWDCVEWSYCIIGYIGYRVSVWGDERVLETVIVVQHCEWTKCHWIIHVKLVKVANVMLYVFCHNFFKYLWKILLGGWEILTKEGKIKGQKGCEADFRASEMRPLCTELTAQPGGFSVRRKFTWAPVRARGPPQKGPLATTGRSGNVGIFLSYGSFALVLLLVLKIPLGTLYPRDQAHRVGPRLELWVLAVGHANLSQAR